MDSPKLSDELSTEPIIHVEDYDASLEVSDHASAAEWGTRIQFKRLDKIRDPGKRFWELRDTVEAEVTANGKKEGRYDEYADYAFIVRRKIIPPLMPDRAPTYVMKVFVWSRWLRSVLQDVLKDPTVWWDTQPVKLDPQTLLAYLPRLKEHLNLICPGISLDIESEETQITAQHLQLLISYLEADYASTLTKISNLLSHREMTWDLLWAIFLPNNTILATCPVTSERRAYKLRDIQLETSSRTGGSCWKLNCEYIEASCTSYGKKTFGWSPYKLEIQPFGGRKKIDRLSAYPIQWDPQPESVQVSLVHRGRRWASIPEVHHMQATGLGYKPGDWGGPVKYNVQGRIMIDRATYASINHDEVPEVSETIELSLIEEHSDDRSEDDSLLLYASPILYCFDLTDKHWLQFNVQNVSEIKWNDNIFKNLTIDQNTKTILQSLIETHAEDRPFDDFVEGKGLGLVINLFGSPGVGKSLTVEAISEHLRRPLYVVGAGELGTNASAVDDRLKEILSLIPKWNAILLIDEADVFLEKRGTHDLERNAVVAVFLRQIEYFRGILFLTTNRAKEFDHAFQSRIHLSLHYKDLDVKTRTQLWTTFLNKAGDNPYSSEEISSEKMDHLAIQNLNGRQIKNVVKVATSLARFEKAPLGYEYIVRTLELVGGSPPDRTC